MRLLVLDLATTLGFCFGTEAGVIEHGSHSLPKTGENIGAFLHAYRVWLSAAISRWQPEDVVFESPILGTGCGLVSRRKLYGLSGLTELVTQDAGRRCRESNLSDIRRHFIGAVRAPKTILQKRRRAWMKAQIIARCEQAGFRPADDNAADAIALFSYVMSLRCPGYVLAGTDIGRAA